MWAPVLMMLVLGSVTSLRITPDTQITHLGSGDKKLLNCFGSSSSAWWGEYNLTYVECGTRGGIDDKVGIYLHYMFGRFYLSIFNPFPAPDILLLSAVIQLQLCRAWGDHTASGARGLGPGHHPLLRSQGGHIESNTKYSNFSIFSCTDDIVDTLNWPNDTGSR